MTTSTHSYSSQQGFSLIELMVAMTLGLVLTWGVLTFFQDSLQSSKTAISSTNMQDIAQVALETIKTDVRMAGFRGECVPADAPATPGSVINQFYTAMGEEGNGTNSDLLQIYTADIQDEALFLWNYDQTNNQLQVCTNPREQVDANGNQVPCTAAEYATTDLFLLSDCKDWAVFNPDRTSTAASPSTVLSPAQTNLDLHDYLLPGTSVDENNPAVRSESATAFVLFKVGTSATSGATQYQVIQDNNPDHALRSGAQPSILFRNNEPLVYGIENLQVLYGRSVNGLIQYSTGCSATDLAAPDTCSTNLAGTTHLKISLIVQSDQRSQQSAAQAFNIANPEGRNTFVSPEDGRLRRVYTTTIQLRNTF